MGFLGFKRKKEITDSVEDTLAVIEHDIIATCSQYADNQAKRVYVLAYDDNNYFSTSYFFEFHKHLYRPHELDCVSQNYDTNPEKQAKCQKKINRSSRKIFDILKKNNRDVPTQIRMVYNSHNHGFNVDYAYDSPFAGEKKNAASCACEQWMKELESTL